MEINVTACGPDCCRQFSILLNQEKLGIMAENWGEASSSLEAYGGQIQDRWLPTQPSPASELRVEWTVIILVAMDKKRFCQVYVCRIAFHSAQVKKRKTNKQTRMPLLLFDFCHGMYIIYQTNN